jgi:hypothetical protein
MRLRQEGLEIPRRRPRARLVRALVADILRNAAEGWPALLMLPS